jgi:hypothetical protein
VQRREGTSWNTLYVEPVVDGKFSDAVVLLTALSHTFRFKAQATAGHKAVLSKQVTITAAAPVQLADLTGDGPSISPAINVRDFIAVSVTWTCAAEPNGHAMAIEVLSGGQVIGNVTVAPTATGEDDNLVETDSAPISVEVVGATDCHWEAKVIG